MRKLTAPEEWDRHLAAQAVSGKTVKSYCRANDLDLSSFYRQRRKRSNIDSDAQPRAFVLAGAMQSPKVCGSSLSIRVKDVTLTLDPGYCSNDLELVLVTLAKVRDVLCPE
jgi:hypothetical protein